MNVSYDCDRLVKEYKQSNERCEPLWDTKLCWPMASLEEVVNLPCPGQKFTNQTASRICILEDEGNSDRPLWTEADYSRCPDPNNYTGLVFNAARYKYQAVRDDKLRNARTRLHMHMLMAMILQVIMWLIHSVLFDNQLLDGYMYLEVLSKINIQVASKYSSDFRHIVEQLFSRMNSYLHFVVIAGLERYFETATLFWLLMEGWFLYELICHKPLETKTSIKRYVIIGWGIPLLLVSPWMTSHLYSSYNDVYWVKHDITVYIIAVSIFITFMINLYFFVKITKVLFDKMKISVQLQQKKMEYKTWVRSTFMLVLLFGAQNILYCVWFFIDKTKPKLLFLLIIKVTSSFQGCFVSFIYCFLNQEVRATLKKNLTSESKQTSSTNTGPPQPRQK